MNITPDVWPADTEHLRTRITRLEAQSETRGLQIEYMKARIQSVRDVLDNIDTSNDPALHDGFADILHALEV
ncbi:hypothetical protein [Brachybacterium sp. FME24]|uniref:hypothetical protein n=1 Tax=Brachybacterium sp. FME24 TaxID=2742605 RepID=UPI0018693E35|nr:hypothetical protein [Brachybacterium sp. FME24]